jgi:hypothetical protein
VPNHRSLLLLTFLLPHTAVAAAQTAGLAGGAATAPASPLRLVRTLSGTQGEMRDGRFVILDPRTSFRLPEDAKIVVYFEWLGAPGKHLMVGTWRGPGNTSTSSSFEYVAPNRSFSAYWELTLPASAPLGQWSLEATVDGMPAGTHAFEVVGPEAMGPVKTAARVPLSRQEIFARTLETVVVVEALDANGSRLATGPGVILDETTIATSFGLLNNAARVRVKPRTAAAVESADVLTWHHRQDWAIVPVPAMSGAVPVTRATEAVKPGDLCYSANAGGGDGVVTVASCEIVGQGDVPGVGPRLTASFFSAGGAPGAPLLNEYGELIGMMTEGPFERASTLRFIRLGQMGQPSAPAAAPVGALPSPPWPARVTLSELAAKGLFTLPVTHERHVLSGGFATAVVPKGASTQPVDQRNQFQKTDKTLTAFLTWSPAERIRGTTTLRIFDIDNRLLGETKPTKLSMRPGDLSMSVWTLNVPPPGAYRVDVMLNTDIAWRGYFVVTE